jgi:hypothetical protein
MPLRDHFHPPLSNKRSWDALHGGWPMVMVMDLNNRLPPAYLAEPQIHLGANFEIDVATTTQGELRSNAAEDATGGIATAVWAPPEPTLAVATDLPDVDEYEVRVIDTETGRLVAAVELVSPANKDRPETRRAFAAKCETLLHHGVSVTIVDLVTLRDFNLYGELLDLIGQTDPLLSPEPPSVYAVACRWRRRANQPFLETWARPLKLGEPLPTLPLWLASDLAIPLDLESSYEQTCRALRIP